MLSFKEAVGLGLLACGILYTIVFYLRVRRYAKYSYAFYFCEEGKEDYIIDIHKAADVRDAFLFSGFIKGKSKKFKNYTYTVRDVAHHKDTKVFVIKLTYKKS